MPNLYKFYARIQEVYEILIKAESAADAQRKADAMNSQDIGWVGHQILGRVDYINLAEHEAQPEKSRLEVKQYLDSRR